MLDSDYWVGKHGSGQKPEFFLARKVTQMSNTQVEFAKKVIETTLKSHGISEFATSGESILSDVNSLDLYVPISDAAAQFTNSYMKKLELPAQTLPEYSGLWGTQVFGVVVTITCVPTEYYEKLSVEIENTKRYINGFTTGELAEFRKFFRQLILEDKRYEPVLYELFSRLAAVGQTKNIQALPDPPPTEHDSPTQQWDD